MSKKKTTLQTENAENLIYQNELLRLTVLGGIKIEGLDRMRATLKIALQPAADALASSIPPVRHNLDLYNDTQLEKFIRKTAEKLEIGTSVIAASIAELTEQLEIYRLTMQKESTAASSQNIKPLTTAARTAAIDFLKTKDLLTHTNEMIGKSGMIGEAHNRLLMYLIFTSRKLHQPLHIVSLGASGIGKTHLQEKIGALIPQEDKIEITTLSENAFYYFGQRELKNKLILIEDLDGVDSALYPLRELQSKKRISKTIAHKNTKGETRTIHLIVEGPVSVAGCTTQEQIYEDNANRSFLIYLDESKAQDRRIMEYQRKIAAGKIDKTQEQQAVTLLQNTQRVLQPIKVINPYAEALKIPEEVLKPRRTNNHYLQFIEVVTYYNQYQRTWFNIKSGEVIYEPSTESESIARNPEALANREEIYIETTLADIQEANILLKEILIRKSDELTGACRNYLENIKQYLKERNEANKGQTDKGQKNNSQSGTGFTNREIRKALRVNGSNQKRYNGSLISNYYIKSVSTDSKNPRKKGIAYRYEIVSDQEFEILSNHIVSVLDKNLAQLKAQEQPIDTEKAALPTTEWFTSPQVVQTSNEPLKPLETNKMDEQSTTITKKVMRPKKNELPEHLQNHVHWLHHYLKHRGTNEGKEENQANQETQEKQRNFSNAEINQHSDKSGKTIRSYHHALTKQGYLQKAGNFHSGYNYTLL